jgi:hypothetical protein
MINISKTTPDGLFTLTIVTHEPDAPFTKREAVIALKALSDLCVEVDLVARELAMQVVTDVNLGVTQ